MKVVYWQKSNFYSVSSSYVLGNAMHSVTSAFNSSNICHISHVTCCMPMLHVTCHILHARNALHSVLSSFKYNYVTCNNCNMSHFTCHLSYITCPWKCHAFCSECVQPVSHFNLSHVTCPWTCHALFRVHVVGQIK